MGSSSPRFGIMMKIKNIGVATTYCWWLKSCTTKDDDYPIIYRGLTIPGGAGSLGASHVLVQGTAATLRFRGGTTGARGAMLATAPDIAPLPLRPWRYPLWNCQKPNKRVGVWFLNLGLYQIPLFKRALVKPLFLTGVCSKGTSSTVMAWWFRDFQVRTSMHWAPSS